MDVMQAGNARMKFEPVRRESTRHKVYGAIREAILDGRLRIGQRLTEVSLAKEFHVSRAVIREALQQLAHDGLVEQNAYRGSRVVHLSPHQVDEIIAARILIESEAVRLAVSRMTDADHKYLEELGRRIHEAGDDPDATADTDLAFHEKLWELSNNETLQKILLQITAPLFAVGSIIRRAARIREGGRSSSFRRSSHAAIVEKLKSGNANEAVEAIRHHISQNAQLIRKHLEDYLESTGDGIAVKSDQGSHKTTSKQASTGRGKQPARR